MDDLIPVLLEQRKRPAKKQNDISETVEITAEWPVVNAEAGTSTSLVRPQTKLSKTQNGSGSGGRTLEVRRTQRTSSRRVVDGVAQSQPEWEMEVEEFEEERPDLS
jgi:hypothetical protein